MNRNPESIHESLNSLRCAKRIALGTILLLGSFALTRELSTQLASQSSYYRNFSAAPRQAYTYSGIGVEIDYDPDSKQMVVTKVFPNTPADQKLFPGAILISVDGERPTCTRMWGSKIRGREGSKVDIEVAYPHSGHQAFTFERKLIHVVR